MKPFEEIKIDSFKELYKETTGEELTNQVLNKLELYETNQGKKLATNALALLSDDKLKKELFPYAKIECARFKGTIPGNFIDQKTIDGQVGLQADLAYQFVLRHISEGTIGYEGVYRKDRWEYPVMAIREIIRNAVIHRNYSLAGKDIKIAILDDKIEITSPGKLLPSIDYEDMESGQSDIRNKILAPVFKQMGIIEQWGNGLQLISDELTSYPEIELKWKEPGLAFRVSFVKKNYKEQDVKTVEETVEKTVEKILRHITSNPKITADQLTGLTGLSRRGVEYNLDKLKKEKRIKRLGGDKGGSWKII